MALPRLERGDYDGVWRACSPWTDLRKMLASIQEAVKETSEDVLSANRPAERLVGFAMHQTVGDDAHTWVWEAHIADIKRCQADDPELDGLLIPLTNLSQAVFAKRLSDGEQIVQ